jgi:hypothetical protein
MKMPMCDWLFGGAAQAISASSGRAHAILAKDGVFDTFEIVKID